MKTKNIENLEGFTGVILIPVFETNAKNLVPIEFHGVSVSSKIFYGKKDTYYVAEKYDCVHIFIGLGKTIDYKSLKTIARRIASKEKNIFAKDVVLMIPEVFTLQQVEATISGLMLGTYQLGHFKKKDLHPFAEKDFELALLSKTDYAEAALRAIKIAKTQIEILSLVDLPPNLVTPTYLSNWAQESGNVYGFTTTILDGAASKIEGLDAFLAVGKGSDKEPQFIIMDYMPVTDIPKIKHIGLVGKGITFDTGGLNIKTAGMLHMKCDMAGGAAVLGAMQLIADLKLPVRVTAIVPCCENSVDSTSFMPSDVIKSYHGATIEIIDTDAEGRLILADGLSYLIKNYKPEIIVDIATLTGSSVGTFGYECAALFTNNQTIAQKLQHSGDEIGERLWPLPLWDAYKSDIESDIADVKNYSGKPVAGAISAAKFLEYFTEEHSAWAHLDIAGVAFGDDEFAKSKHATSYGVHLLMHFIENI
ncbi:leucyl aminopeptidase family protein [Flavobacterium sp.]|uniref:leucyl aminopeptidase family protein n=1 Tax=Flavobacterium sp. TaxID=239 RepID=UPI00286BB2EE|nr:leucyl aminopeptidase family protein [Flavobacterium sp.]